ncbi:MAG: DegT/DnrJ/EryC1/StrS family aminotransferase [Clostridia bacterium]|nr:DegT/DnrJ/EryC1/StrS family aminotransferase [Erysipelotrichia bacterium]NCC88568.1 DegT/DnrJ/EryC1/StrS family aminotransferase [Clostridia bacterium]
MEVKVWSYLKEYIDNKKEILKAVEETFESGQLILGDKGRLFEQKYADYCDVSYSVGVDNGTNAIVLALRALNIGVGDEVITVSNTAIPTVSAIVTVGATPVFVDICSDFYLMDVSLVEAKITARTKAILPVHLFGQCVDMEPLFALAKHYGLAVVEDCAQAQGALYKGRKAGSMSDVSTTSFYPTKVLGAYGDGGMILTNSAVLSDRLKRLRFYGAEKTYFALEHGYNSRLDEIQAAILLTKLPKLESYITRRRDIAALYKDKLEETDLILPQEANDNTHVYYLYVVRHPQRDIIIEKLKEAHIYVNISYPWPIHMMPAYSYLGYREGDLPKTELASREIFSLPMYPSLTNEEVLYVCDHLKKILLSI